MTELTFPVVWSESFSTVESTNFRAEMDNTAWDPKTILADRTAFSVAYAILRITPKGKQAIWTDFTELCIQKKKRQHFNVTNTSQETQAEPFQRFTDSWNVVEVDLTECHAIYGNLERPVCIPRRNVPILSEMDMKGEPGLSCYARSFCDPYIEAGVVRDSPLFRFHD